ncbi:chemotaxis protein CheB [Oscillatoria sp. CS-180]|uniref:chemotaxis protein CheB n=1 Tax=Oscillatoria sp. CS-180 TaxID=3021720 RepID=UPI00232D3661|nr:chemotaxis protein CheB [Oscillatoria sp. CS-180]MDB9527738.1 chemotaxis protein CheB [Oscillatoria sp. CS-180]
MTDQPVSGQNNENALLVVGIGASAGGLDVLSEILSHLPLDTGMAFVLMQHLNPDQESLLSEILGRATELPVATAEDGMTVEANHVYVLPPDARMTIANKQLCLESRSPGQRYPKVIDPFFQSLANDCKNNAIAIVLSGSNDDGATGIRAVREAGGITFAQDRTTTEFPEMPSAAIATGQVDFVLAPDKIAEELVKISKHPYLCETASGEADDSFVFDDGELSTIFSLLQKHTGVDFSHYKQTTFERRMRRRMALRKISHLADYVHYLEDNPTEVKALYQDVLITVTNFFRDAEVFTTLRQQVFPHILQQPSASDSIRVWVAGCATGEEAYSVAICLLECIDPLMISPTIQIFGTDVSDQAIEDARVGYYPENRMEGVSSGRRQRFFAEVDGGYQINKSVRELCIFAKHDLSSDPPFSDIDLITCRNVLIYFKPSLQRRVLSIFHYSLRQTGLLMLGNSESVGETSDLFQVFNAQAKVYEREAVPSRINFDFVSSKHPEAADSRQQPDFSASLSQSSIQQWADQIVLNRYAPVGIVINDRLDILQFRGETSPFLRPPLGEPSFNLLKMIRPSLLNEVRSAIEQAKQRSVTIRRQNLRIEETQTVGVSLEVIPFNVSQGRCFLVLFEQEEDSSSVPLELTTDAETNDEFGDPTTEVVQLRQELATVRQELLDARTFLQMTVEEQEATHQQLVAANEEVLSSNEELRSTNEELQTAKEEIQSANEELKTTNEELQSRNAESRRANDDLINLINNVNIPIVMLSSNLHIRSFSPAARGVFNLIPTDVGRPINNIRPNVNITNLEVLIQEVIDTLNSTEQEVKDEEGRWYLLRIRPYRTVENQIDGAVIALIDINNLRRTEEELRASQAQLERELVAMNHMRTLSLQLFASLDLEQALNEVLDAAIAIHQAEQGCAHLYDPERDTLRIVAHREIDQDFLDYFQDIALTDETFYGRTLLQRRRVVIENIQTDPEFESYRQIAADAGIQALQATPLISHNGEMLGVLSTHFSQPYRPSERELRLLDLYARQASGFISLVRAERERQRLQEQEQAARAANASKDRFLSVLSHELRTPLNSILGWSQLLIQGQVRDADVNRAIAAIRNGALVQLQFIEDLLDASRIVQDRFQVELLPVNLTAVVQEAVTAIQPQAYEKSLQLNVDLENCSNRLMADPGRMGQVFSNLLSNAVKFTPSGGQISVRLTYTPSQVRVQISDTGQGIEPELLPYIFDIFRQADDTNTRRTGGLGLGLFLVHSIVAAHEGHVEVESSGENQGTTFTITLPWVVVDIAPPSPTEPRPAEDVSLEGMRVLIVDDTEASLTLYMFALQEIGATVLTAQSAAEALDIIPEETLDVIISDVGLPDINGYEFIQQIRSLPSDQGGDIPAIALTGYTSDQDVQEAIAAGFQMHLPKPVELNDLYDALYRLVRSREG